MSLSLHHQRLLNRLKNLHLQETKERQIWEERLKKLRSLQKYIENKIQAQPLVGNRPKIYDINLEEQERLIDNELKQHKTANQRIEATETILANDDKWRESRRVRLSLTQTLPQTQDHQNANF